MLLARRGFLAPAIAVLMAVVGVRSSSGQQEIERSESSGATTPDFGWNPDGSPTVVYFDFDSVDLNYEASQRLRKILRSLRGLEIASITVDGHTDRAGSEAYNARLAAQRADTVASAFQICGLLPDETKVTQHGETAPAVETADGAREPRNRRVELFLSLDQSARDAREVQARSQPPEEKTFVLTFDFDSATLSSEAKQDLAKISAYAVGINDGQLVVSGHTDRSGSEAYNEKLSSQRAQEVAQAIIACGFDFDNIDLSYEGETKPAVETPDGVQEPRNRRVEITIKPT
ncbi:MAG: OmpA family protein [Geminicoccaceae bacterium]